MSAWVLVTFARSDASRLYRQYVSAVLLHGHASAKACGLGATDLYALNVLELSGAAPRGFERFRRHICSLLSFRRFSKAGFSIGRSLGTS
jgi:hypothetical protein